MNFIVKDGPLPLSAKGLLLKLTRHQADRRRGFVKRVMEDGGKVSILPALMRPAPELPELGVYALEGAFELKSGEVIGFPPGVDVMAKLGKEVMRQLEPMDDEARASVETAVPKAEKKPKQPHGGPVAFGPTVPGSTGSAPKAVAASATTAPAPEVKKADPTAAHSISKTGKK